MIPEEIRRQVYAHIGEDGGPLLYHTDSLDGNADRILRYLNSVAEKLELADKALELEEQLKSEERRCLDLENEIEDLKSKLCSGCMCD